MKKLKDDLKVVTRELKKIVRKVEVLSNRADRLEKKQIADAKKEKAKKPAARKTATRKPVKRRAAPKKAAAKKPLVKRVVKRVTQKVMK